MTASKELPTEATRASLGARIALGFVAFYQGHLRDLGPLARVRCSFEQTESCSEFGMRALEERGLVQGTRITARRIRRCGQASAMAKGRTLCSTPLLDCSSQEIQSELGQLGEQPASVGLVLGQRALILQKQGQLGRAARLSSQARSLGFSGPVKVRCASAAMGRQAERARAASRAVVALIVFTLVAGLFFQLPREIALLLFSGAACAATVWWGASRRLRSLQGRLSRAHFRVSGAVVASRVVALDNTPNLP